jgi:hypothetical protein
MEYKKECLRCGKEYTKPYYTGKPEWEGRKYCSNKCKYGTGEKSSTWVGDKITKASVHNWIARALGRPNKCEICGTTAAPQFDWSNKYHTYKRIVGDWQRLCKKCHHHYDMENNGYEPRKHFVA